MAMGMRAAVGLVLAASGAVPAKAEWLEATSRHFVLYSDTSERQLRRRAERLERLDWALRRFQAADDIPEAASNRVTVYLLPGREIRRLCGCDTIAGWYMGRVSGPVAFSAADAGSDNADDNSMGNMVVLNHEYAHHFLLGSYELAFPAWYSEGFAEFASTMRLKPDRVTIGMAANHRAYGLLLGRPIKAEAMFDPAVWAGLRGVEKGDAFYGRGWLMTHYFNFDPARRKQFVRYLTLLNSGTPSLVAAREAFGDLATLDGELTRYLRKSTLPALTMMLADTPAPAVAIRRLSAGEAAMIRFRTESTRGVNETTSKTLLAKAAPVAARFPGDAVVQGWFAEIAADAGDDAAAEAAADRALAVDPKSVQALLCKARIRLRAVARDAKANADAWVKARKPIVAANRLDPDDAEPLWLFYESFGMEGRPPIKSALAGLYRAQELVPQAEDVRFAASVARIMAGDTGEAKRLLRPLAYNPHAGTENPAARMLAALEAGKTGPAAIAAGSAPAAPVGAPTAR